MPRPIGSKNKSAGRRFKPYEGHFPDDKHLRLTKDMMMDESFLKLSSSAKTLYIYLKLWACGRDTVVYSASMAKDYMSNKTYLKARDELVKEGFIDYVNYYRARDMRETAEYEFSSQWRLKSSKFGNSDAG